MSDPLSYSIDQPFLMPVDLREWLPKKDIAYFISDLVDRLDLSAITYRCQKVETRGRRAFSPLMMTKLIVYSFVSSVSSSRKIEEATFKRIDFRVLAANQHPDHSSIAAFRKTHAKALADLFSQVLDLCVEAELVAFESVSVDGTKIMANASIRKNRTEASLVSERAHQMEFFKDQAEQYLKDADAADAEDDARFGKDDSGNKIDERLGDRKARIAKIDEMLAARKKDKEARAAKGKSEATAGESSPAQDAGEVAPDERENVSGDNTKVNMTDPDSRIMRDGATKGFVQGYNCQAAVDSAAQIIVAAAVTQDANDKQQLVPMVNEAVDNVGGKPKQVLADAGYFSDKQVTDGSLNGIEMLVPPDRACTTSEISADHEQEDPDAEDRVGSFVKYREPVSAADRMRAKLRTPQGRADYAKRSQTVEPVFGQIKAAGGYRRFLMRGMDLVRMEWQMICTASNLKKLYRATVGKPKEESPNYTPNPRSIHGQELINQLNMAI